MTYWEIQEESRYFVRLAARDTVLTLSDRDRLIDAGLEIVSANTTNSDVFGDIVRWKIVHLICKKTWKFNREDQVFCNPSK